MSRNLSLKKDGAKFLIATSIGLALVLGLAFNGLKLYGKPPSWKIISERYGVSSQFQFGKSWHLNSVACSGFCTGSVIQRISLGPLYYQRELTATWPAGYPDSVTGKVAGNGRIFAELE